MARYMFYMLDQTGRIMTGSDAECGSDARAFAWARTTLGDHAHAEIWQDARCVGHVSGAATGAVTLPSQLSVMFSQPLMSLADA